MVRHARVPAIALAVLLVVSGCGASPTPPPESAPRPSGNVEVPSASDAPPSPSLPADTAAPASPRVPTVADIVEYPVPRGSHPHDVAPATDGGVWYTGQAVGVLGHLDPATGAIREVGLGSGSRPHGVITGPDGAPWITDGGRNAILRVDPATGRVTEHPLPGDRPAANLNTAAFDAEGVLWFTGQSGVYGRLDPAGGVIEVWDAPRGRGPYGIAATPHGEVWFVSLAGSYLARIDRATGEATVIEPPTTGQGARRVWSDPAGRLFVAEWNAGQVGMHDPADGSWREWRLPGPNEPEPYAVFVDEQGIAWLTDFGNNAIVRFDPATGAFTQLLLPDDGAAIRQLLGRPGEVWGAESGLDRLVVVRTDAGP